jgi:hypothetical protein
MTTDAVLSRELKSLQDEISDSNRERPSPPPDRRVTPSGQPEDKPQGQPSNGQIREFVKDITEFFADAENKVSAHPAASVIGAMVVGILIGRLLGRR